MWFAETYANIFSDDWVVYITIYFTQRSLRLNVKKDLHMQIIQTVTEIKNNCVSQKLAHKELEKQLTGEATSRWMKVITHVCI